MTYYIFIGIKDPSGGFRISMLSRVYEIYSSELKANIQYRMLPVEELEKISGQKETLMKDEYVKLVLEATIANLKTDITPALRKVPKNKAHLILQTLLSGAVMLNPPLDVDTWTALSQVQESRGLAKQAKSSRGSEGRKRKTKKLTKTKFLNLSQYLHSKVIGQTEAVETISSALKRSLAGLNDESRPLGVFIFAGASGVGKTHLAKELHKYLFGDDYKLIRLDCGEYQHKHENQKLLGAPPGYIGHDDGGQLTNQILKHPQTVVLLDEVEKAHADIWHSFLRVFDEGFMTDGQGREVDFRETVIIMTTNLGNAEIVRDITGRKIGFGQNDATSNPGRDRIIRIANEKIKENFTPEFLNRIDQVVVFNHLERKDFASIAELEISFIQEKLEKKGFSLIYDDSAVESLVKLGISPVRGARGLSKIRREKLEDPLADLLIKNTYPRGTIFQVTAHMDDFYFIAEKPSKSQQLTAGK